MPLTPNSEVGLQKKVRIGLGGQPNPTDGIQGFKEFLMGREAAKRQDDEDDKSRKIRQKSFHIH